MITLLTNLLRQKKMLDYVWQEIKNNMQTLKKQSAKIKVYLVFIGIFNFLGGKLKLTHALFHSCLPFLDFLGQIVHLYKYLWLTLVYTYFKPLQTFSFVVTYWHALENA